MSQGTFGNPEIVEVDTDVLIVGGGQTGLAVAFQLRRSGVDRVRVVDSQAPGREGPWITFARMETLRTRKDMIGLEAGFPSLTFRAWYEARFGAETWDALDRIPRPTWMDYLLWFRSVLGLAVDNGVVG
jgi:cation diffusion facilitator CzcD-associated flavoprotein CzcO